MSSDSIPTNDEAKQGEDDNDELPQLVESSEYNNEALGDAASTSKADISDVHFRIPNRGYPKTFYNLPPLPKLGGGYIHLKEAFNRKVVLITNGDIRPCNDNPLHYSRLQELHKLEKRINVMSSGQFAVLICLSLQWLLPKEIPEESYYVNTMKSFQAEQECKTLMATAAIQVDGAEQHDFYRFLKKRVKNKTTRDDIQSHFQVYFIVDALGVIRERFDDCTPSELEVVVSKYL